VAELLDEPIEIQESAAAVPLPEVRGDIEFDDVTLSFGRGGAVLEHLSFEARAGEVLAIVGPSGSGKSTIADLLLRLLDPDAGVVRIDGRDLRTVRPEDLRQRVSLVDQEPTMLHATIGENIRYARPDATDAEGRDAARQAASARFIERLPQQRHGGRRARDGVVRRGAPAHATARVPDQPVDLISASRRRHSTRRRRARWWTGTSASCAAAPSSSSPTAPSQPAAPIASSASR
jgi:ABC-type multidrug transport system fused ATPase/permease subunit